MPNLNSKKLAKNTAFLYLRMTIVMVISLYTSRVVLRTLGILDFGIYNAVGGLVGMFALLSGSIGTTITRFITFALGKDNIQLVKETYSSAINIQLFLSFFLGLLIELIGSWFLNNHMNIPVERMHAANWAFQCSILIFMLNLLNVPFSAILIAYEDMRAFAYIGILEVALKLVIVFMLSVGNFDKLIMYSILFLLTNILIRIIYTVYIKTHFKDCKYIRNNNYSLLKEMMIFAGWNYFGAGGYIMKTQGINLLMNVFFGPIINAARGIATQIENALIQFISSISNAIKPQIIKSYADDKKEYLYNLLCHGSKAMFYLMFIISVPLFYEIELILDLWLVNYPPISIVFIRITIITLLLSSIQDLFSTIILATGKIKKYQIIVGTLNILILPICYILFKLGLEAEWGYWICFGVQILSIVVSVIIPLKMIGLDFTLYFKKTIKPISKVFIIGQIVPLLIYCNFTPGIKRLCLLSLFSILTNFLIIVVFGMSINEKKYTIHKIKSHFNTKNDEYNI